MTDRREIPVETTEGWRPAPSGGERILVALAAVALLGGALIVGGSLLHKDDEVSVASASPRPTARQTPTPRPSPTPRELTVAQESPAPPESAPLLFSGWIRAKVDLPILDGPDASAAVLGTLAAGSVAYADQQVQEIPEQGWLTIQGPGPTGWVATRAHGKDLVRRYLPADFPVSGGLWTLAAGPGGFVAIGNATGRSSSYSPPTVFASTDGASWHAASEPPTPGSNLAGAAWGPAGWLLVSSDAGSESTRVWSSPDGDHWRSLGLLDAGFPNGIHASSFGYLLQTAGRSNGSGEAWFSSDGIRWSESNPDLAEYYEVTAMTAGFYAAIGHGLPAAFSADGITWSTDLPNLLVAAVGSSLVGIETDPERGSQRAVAGSLGREVSWQPFPGGDLPFASAVVTSLVSDGQRATALGWDPTTEKSIAWTSDGGPWTRENLPATFGGPPLLAAAGERGVIVIGNRWNSRGSNPLVWHRTADGIWEPERSPVLDIAQDPSADDCDARPTNAVEFVNLDFAMAATCYGDAPLTIRFWSRSCDECPGQYQGTYEEAWLASPTGNLLNLSPVSWPGYYMSVVLAPAVGPSADPTWLDTWLELTGHFDDSAAMRCHWTPRADQLQYYPGARSLIEACRQEFVVTKVRVVGGP